MKSINGTLMGLQVEGLVLFNGTMMIATNDSTVSNHISIRHQTCPLQPTTTQQKEGQQLDWL